MADEAQQDWFEVRVLYKSGQEATFVTDDFAVKTVGPTTTYSWGRTRGWRPMYLGAEDVEAVYARPIDDGA